jgi:hypothetical protein
VRTSILWAQAAVVVSIVSISAAGENALSSWIAQKPADRGSLEMFCGNYSRSAWNVGEDGGALSVSPVDARARRRTSPEALERARSIPGLRVTPDAWIVTASYSRGWLLGFNRGEFGGGLWWVPAGAGHPQQLSTEPVEGFVPLDDRLLVLSGLAHMTISQGGVFEVTTDSSGGIGLRLVADLGACPYAAHSVSGSLIVACSHGIARVSLAGRVEWLSRTDYEPLTPRSIVALPSGAVYMGMNRFVAELVPNAGAYAETWYVPGDCVRFEVDTARIECECRPSR